MLLLSDVAQHIVNKHTLHQSCPFNGSIGQMDLRFTTAGTTTRSTQTADYHQQQQPAPTVPSSSTQITMTPKKPAVVTMAAGTQTVSGTTARPQATKWLNLHGALVAVMIMNCPTNTKA